MAIEIIRNWTDLPCGYAYKWDGEEGRLSDSGIDEVFEKSSILAEIKADCGLDLDYNNDSGWDTAFGEEDATVSLVLANA